MLKIRYFKGINLFQLENHKLFSYILIPLQLMDRYLWPIWLVSHFNWELPGYPGDLIFAENIISSAMFMSLTIISPLRLQNTFYIWWVAMDCWVFFSGENPTDCPYARCCEIRRKEILFSYINLPLHKKLLMIITETSRPLIMPLQKPI